MSDYRHLSADAAIFLEGGLLLIRRDGPPFEDHWALPGGMVEMGETAPEAAEREAREEVGLDVEAVEFLGLFDDPERDERRNVSAAYLCVPTGDGEPVAGEEASGIGAFDPGDLPEPMAFDHRDIVEAAVDARDKA